MIEPYKVTALRLGLLQDIDYSQIVYLKDMGTKMDFPVWGVLLQGQGKNILVDLGIYDPEWASQNIIKCVREEIDDPMVGIKKAAGLSPEHIDYIIFTHLHWDHIGEDLKPFKKARFVVQEKEWKYMFKPVSYQKWAYKSSVGVCLDKGLDFFQWHYVSGWMDILPGLRVMPAPGHTPGHQIVMVQTEEGRLIITGDSVNMLENLKLNLPSGIFSNGEDYMASMELIRGYADCIIGGHELGIEPFQTQSFPKVTPLEEE
jgi:N-acyl homoserine lactone hydrolase